MAERSEAVEEQAVRDASAGYSVEPEIATAEDVPPGYKRTEVGVIPEDWQLFALGEILTNVRNGAVYTPVRRDGLSITRIETISNGIIDWTKVGLAKPDIHLKGYLIEKGDILYSHINSVDHIGKVAVFSGDGSLYHGMNLLLLRPENYVYPYWLFFHLASEPARKWARATAKQAVSQASINTKELRKYIIALPSKDEQHAIATALSDADALIESLDRLIAKKRAIKQAAMQQLLTGQTRLPGFAGEWETKRLGDIGKIVTGGTPPTLQKRFWGGAHPWVTPTDISSNREISESPRCLTEEGLKLIGELPPDTVLVTCIASIGKNVILQKRGGCNQQINAIIPGQAHCSEFIYYLIENNKSRLIERAGTTATSILSKANFATLAFAFPSIKEQTAIATVLSDLDTEIEALERRHNKARQIKQGMMQQLLTGRVRLVTPEVAA